MCSSYISLGTPLSLHLEDEGSDTHLAGLSYRLSGAGPGLPGGVASSCLVACIIARSTPGDHVGAVMRLRTHSCPGRNLENLSDLHRITPYLF